MAPPYSTYHACMHSVQNSMQMDIYSTYHTIPYIGHGISSVPLFRGSGPPRQAAPVGAKPVTRSSLAEAKLFPASAPHVLNNTQQARKVWDPSWQVYPVPVNVSLSVVYTSCQGTLKDTHHTMASISSEPPILLHVHCVFMILHHRIRSSG